MSRCSPFPPPGYEKKTREDDVDLKKEKHREKKQKREKKDKERKEGKDKSDGKHKEKKGKNEKNKEKKKDRDREKDKEKTSDLYEKRIAGNSDDHIREKVSNEKRFSVQFEGDDGEVSNEKRFPGRFEGHNGDRISNEKRLPMQSEGHGMERFVPIPKEDKRRHNFSNERKFTGQAAGYNGAKVSRSIPLAEDTRDFKFVQESDKRVREEGKGTGNHCVNEFTGEDQKRDEGMLTSVSKATGNGAGKNSVEKVKRGNERNIGGQGVVDDTRFSGNSMVQNLTKVVQTRVEGVARPSEKNLERKMEGKEKTEGKGGDNKQRDKQKNKDRERKTQGNDKDRKKKKVPTGSALIPLLCVHG